MGRGFVSRVKRKRKQTAHLHQGKLLLTGVVVAGGTLVLLSVVRAVLVGVLVCRVHKFPRILWWSEKGDIHTKCKMLNFWSDSHNHHQNYQRPA